MKEGAKPERDGLRKLVSGRLRSQAAGPHPDPDVLAAFAENALVQTERALLLQHLGACDDCREILYLATPDSAAAQKVLSFQPKRRSGLVFRWGALAASVVIVGTAVIANFPSLRHRAEQSKVATAPLSSYLNVADEKAPAADAERTRDRLATPPQPATKERPTPTPKHMTAKPQARMKFDDSGQVTVSAGALTDQSKESRTDGLALTGREVMALTVPGASAAKPVSPPASADIFAKDKKNERRAEYAYANSTGGPGAKRDFGGTIVGTISDPSGAVVSNAKVTVSGAIGTETAISDPEGRFAFNSLTPGEYSIKTEANGFKSREIQQVAVLDNKTATIGVRLEPGATSETVEASGAAVGLNETADAPAPVPAMNGLVFSQKQASTQAGLEEAVVTNSPARAKASRAPAPTPQWTLSAKGAVQRSYDIGKSWQKVSVADGTTFRALCAVGTHVWAGGNAGMLYHSVDSGKSWTRVEPVMADRKLTSDVTHIEFSDPANGSVSTANGEVWTTSDGGRNWRRK